MSQVRCNNNIICQIAISVLIVITESKIIHDQTK